MVALAQATPRWRLRLADLLRSRMAIGCLLFLSPLLLFVNLEFQAATGVDAACLAVSNPADTSAERAVLQLQVRAGERPSSSMPARRQWHLSPLGL